MANEKIRKLLTENRIKYYELANELGIADSSLSRMLRFELSPEKKKQVLDATQRLIQSINGNASIMREVESGADEKDYD